MDLMIYYFSIVLFLLSQGDPQTIKVNTISSLQQAINEAVPGDRIIVADGNYTTTDNIIISRKGTKEKPLTIESESTGGVVISGSNGFLINSASSYIIIKGFRFTHKTGTFKIEPGATNCTITRNIFECEPVGSGAKPYLNVSGDDCEISFNTFQNKMDEGQMISVQGPGGNKMAKRTWIHHNYFFNFPSTGKNNCSAIQIGLSGRSMDSSFCLVEYNLFERTEGENEGAICHKSCSNIIRFNTFGERSEECSIRHGNNSQVYGNFFISTTGLRFSGDDHLIYMNYFKNCKKAIVCTNGDGEVKEGSPLTCHDRPDRVKVVYNTMEDCVINYQMQDRAKGLGANKIVFSHNLLSGGEPVSIRGPYLNPAWEGNILINTSGGSIPQGGYQIREMPARAGRVDIQAVLKGVTDPVKYPVIPAANKPLTIEDVGPKAQ